MGFIVNLYLVIFIKKVTNKKSSANCITCKNPIK